MSDRQPAKATDSPWFWVYLFSTFALMGLVLIQSKFAQRQTAIEQRGIARQHVANGDSQKPLAEGTESTRLQTVTLKPIMILLAFAITIGWIVFWNNQRRRNLTHVSKDAEQLVRQASEQEH
jgi:uncharacterized protein HemX